MLYYVHLLIANFVSFFLLVLRRQQTVDLVFWAKKQLATNSSNASGRLNRNILAVNSEQRAERY